MMSKPDHSIEKLPGYRVTERPADALQSALAQLAQRHGLDGPCLYSVRLGTSWLPVMGPHACDGERNG